MPVTPLLPVPSERDALHDNHVVAEPGRLADHHTAAAREEEGLQQQQAHDSRGFFVNTSTLKLVIIPTGGRNQQLTLPTLHAGWMSAPNSSELTDCRKRARLSRSRL